MSHCLWTLSNCISRGTSSMQEVRASGAICPADLQCVLQTQHDEACSDGRCACVQACAVPGSCELWALRLSF